jgi:hypothetical protein
MTRFTKFLIGASSFVSLAGGMSTINQPANPVAQTTIVSPAYYQQKLLLR